MWLFSTNLKQQQSPMVHRAGLQGQFSELNVFSCDFPPCSAVCRELNISVLSRTMRTTTPPPQCAHKLALFPHCICPHSSRTVCVLSNNLFVHSTASSTFCAHRDVRETKSALAISLKKEALPHL